MACVCVVAAEARAEQPAPDDPPPDAAPDVAPDAMPAPDEPAPDASAVCPKCGKPLINERSQGSPGSTKVLPQLTMQVVGFSVEKMDRTADPRSDYRRYAAGGWMGAPLIGRDGRALGVLHVMKRDTAFTEPDVSIAAHLARLGFSFVRC